MPGQRYPVLLADFPARPACPQTGMHPFFFRLPPFLLRKEGFL